MPRGGRKWGILLWAHTAYGLKRSIYSNRTVEHSIKAVITYRTVKNFGGEKILANLAKCQNSPSFFHQFILHIQQRIVIWCALIVRSCVRNVDIAIF